MNPTVGEVISTCLLIASAYCLLRFLGQLRHVRSLSEEMVEVPIETLPAHVRHRGDLSYRVAKSSIIRMSRWDTLPPEEKLKNQRGVERWSVAVGLFFIGAFVVGYVSWWAFIHCAPNYWLNLQLF